MPNCYYYDEQRNHCNCYVNENLNELLAENARLRERIDAAHMSRLLTENENESLRELVRDLWKACPADGYYCIYHCEHYDKESESHCKLEDRMRELGVDE